MVGAPDDGSGPFFVGLTVCRFAMGGIFTANVNAEHKTLGHH